MVKITVELLKKRAEHNDGSLADLEEIALHQFKIRKIETINQVCRCMKILLLQNNKITKIENLNRLKQLKYLNIGINRIKHIENLEGCESLSKLDMTLNMVYDYREVRTLSGLTQLYELFLVGNPCTDQKYYREFVIVNIPSLIKLDGKEITRAERIEASQVCAMRREEIQQMQFEEGRDLYENSDNSDYEENDTNTRIRRAAEEAALAEAKRKKIEVNHVKGLKNDEGLPMQWNELHLNYSVHEVFESQEIMVKIDLPNFLSSSSVEVDMQQDYLYVQIKSSSLQLRLPRKVYFSRCRAVRVDVTGQLKLYCPVLETDAIPDDRWLRDREKNIKQQEIEAKIKEAQKQNQQDSHEYELLKQQQHEANLPDDLPDLI